MKESYSGYLILFILSKLQPIRHRRNNGEQTILLEPALVFVEEVRVQAAIGIVEREDPGTVVVSLGGLVGLVAHVQAMICRHAKVVALIHEWTVTKSTGIITIYIIPSVTYRLEF